MRQDSSQCCMHESYIGTAYNFLNSNGCVFPICRFKTNFDPKALPQFSQTKSFLNSCLMAMCSLRWKLSVNDLSQLGQAHFLSLPPFVFRTGPGKESVMRHVSSTGKDKQQIGNALYGLLIIGRFLST